MRKLLIMTCAAVCLAMQASAAVHLSHWDFSSDSLGEFDYTGRNDLVNANSVTIADGAAVFSGSATQFITGHNVDFRENQAYTIECFVLADVDCNGMIMESSPNITNPGSEGSFYLYAKEGVMVNGSGNGKNGVNFDGGSICDGKWHHVAVIVDPSGETAADKVKLYLDGVQQTTQVQGKTDSCLRPHRLYIGSRGGKSLPFKGKIDDIRITEGILSTSQFLQTRSAGNIDVRAYWKFDESAPLADSSGNGNNLFGSLGVAFVNGCASFNGSKSDVRTENKLDLSAYKDVTVEFFLRKHSGADSLGMVMEHSQQATSYSGAFYFSLNENHVGAVNGLFRLSDGYRLGESTAGSLNAGWHHVALVKNSSNSGNAYCTSLYVDGVRIGEYSGAAKGSSAFLLNEFLYIGSRQNSQFFLDADIDDVRITAQVLEPGQFLRKRTGALDDVIAYWPFEKAANMFDDASGNGNALTGIGVTVNDDYGAAVFDGSQSGFATLAPLPLYPYDSMTVEWFMKTEMSDLGMVMEISSNTLNNPGAFYAAVNEYAGFQMTRTHSLVQDWSVADGKWHHYAIVFDWDSTTADIVRFYRDGTQISTRLSSNTSPARLRADRLFIGARNGSSFKFVGQLDDIKITGRALAPAEFMAERSRPQHGVVICIR